MALEAVCFFVGGWGHGVQVMHLLVAWSRDTRGGGINQHDLVQKAAHCLHLTAEVFKFYEKLPCKFDKLLATPSKL